MEGKGDGVSQTRREVLKKTATGVLVLGAGGLVGCGSEKPSEKSQDSTSIADQQEKPQDFNPDTFKKQVSEFSWHDVEDPDRLSVFSSSVADAYIHYTNSPRLTKDSLVGDQLRFARSRDEFIEKVRENNPNYVPTETQWGYTDFSSGNVTIDLDSLGKQALEQNGDAGISLVNALWHEWGHKDIEIREQGELLHNPSISYFSEESGRNEPWEYYRGGAVYTETYSGMLHFEEVLNETLTVLRMVKDLGLEQVISGRDYYYNGVDFFPKVVELAGITNEELYAYHSTSDLEGLARRIGSVLPVSGDPLIKGINLFTGIHLSDTDIIGDTGVFDLLNQNAS
jgi:hypothetical protein